MSSYPKSVFFDEVQQSPLDESDLRLISRPPLIMNHDLSFYKRKLRSFMDVVIFMPF